MSKIPRQTVRMPEGEGSERVMQVLAELAALDEQPALSSALAFVVTMDAAGHVDITSNVDPASLVALLRLVAMNVAAVAQVDGGGALFDHLRRILEENAPSVVVDLSLTGQPFAWTVQGEQAPAPCGAAVDKWRGDPVHVHVALRCDLPAGHDGDHREHSDERHYWPGPGGLTDAYDWTEVTTAELGEPSGRWIGAFEIVTEP